VKECYFLQTDIVFHLIRKKNGSELDIENKNNCKKMKFTVEIGKEEKQVISYSFNKFWGTVKIMVNGKKVKSDLRMYSFDLSKTYEFIVGLNEKHDIKIEKIRPLFNAGFRSNTYKIFVDDQLFKEFKD
jgi:spermidine/putrescine-binding protein